jgi:hypothetical protein
LVGGRSVSSVISVAGASPDFESDEWSAAGAGNVGHESERAGIVLEGDTGLGVAAFELAPGFWNAGSATWRPELGWLRGAGRGVEFEGDEREKREDGETKRLKAFFHGSILLWFFLNRAFSD